MRPRARRAAAVAGLALACACTGEAGPESRRFGVSLEPLPPVPGFDALDPFVRDDYRQRADALARSLADAQVSREALAQAFGGLGMWHHAYGHLAAARAAYRNAARLRPDVLRWTYYLAVLDARSHEFGRAREGFRRAARLRPDYAPSYVHLAEIEVTDHDQGAALALLETAVARDPGNPRALALMGRIALDRGDAERAAQLFETALQRDPQRAEIHYQLGTAYRRLGDEERARAHLERGTASGPAKQLRPPALGDPLLAEIDVVGQSASFRQNRGHRLSAEGRHAEAIAQYREALAADPQNAAARQNLGVALFYAGQPEAARGTFEELLRTHPAEPPHPDLAAAHFGLAALLEAEGRDAEAERHYERSLRNDPDQFRANVGLARLLLRTGREPQALAPLDRALERDPANASLRFDRALALLRLGRDARAAAALESDLRALPGDPLITLLLARLLAASGDAGVRNGARAVELATSLIERAATIASAETLAMAYAEVGDFDRAEAWQRAAVAALPESGDAPWLPARLAGYQKRVACRDPWLPGEAALRNVPVPSPPQPAG